MSGKKDGKWICAPNIYTEEWSASRYYDTKQEAIDAGRSVINAMSQGVVSVDVYDESHEIMGEGYMVKDTLPETFVVGQMVSDYFPWINPECVIEGIGNEAYDEFGEYAEDYLLRLPDEEVSELGDKLNEALVDWIKKYNNEPDFVKMQNVEIVKVRS